MKRNAKTTVLRVRNIQTRLPNPTKSTCVAADLAVATGEADPVDDCVDAVEAVGAPTDFDGVVEADEESVADVTLLGRIPHSSAKSRKPAASVASNGCMQFAQVVIVVAPSGMNGAHEHATSDELHARDWKYAVKLEEHRLWQCMHTFAVKVML